MASPTNKPTTDKAPASAGKSMEGTPQVRQLPASGLPREIQTLRLLYRVNNRLRLETLGLLSKLFRDFGVSASDELLNSLVFAVESELPGGSAGPGVNTGSTALAGSKEHQPDLPDEGDQPDLPDDHVQPDLPDDDDQPDQPDDDDQPDLPDEDEPPTSPPA